MAAAEHLGVQFPPAARAKLPKPITARELPDSDSARATSPEVSRTEWRQAATRGQQQLSKMATGVHDTSKLSTNMGSVTEHAYAATREPWGGATYNPRTGGAVNFTKPDKHALSARDPGQESVTLAENANPQQFAGAMSEAKNRFAGNLQRGQHYLGVFHNTDAHNIQIDPTAVTHGASQAAGEHAAQDISAATRATGGAYSFASGNGVYPPHVKDVYTPPSPR